MVTVSRKRLFSKNLEEEDQGYKRKKRSFSVRCNESFDQLSDIPVLKFPNSPVPSINISGIGPLEKEGFEIIESECNFGEVAAIYDFKASIAMPTLKNGKFLFYNEMHL